jgi:hypothetical protein
MTTLELAEAIADAVLCVRTDAPFEAYRMAVLRTLYDNDSWFCRNSTEDWHEEKEERYEQVELFK